MATVHLLVPDQLNTYDVLCSDAVIFTEGALASGLLPYRAAIGHDIPMIMLSNATYTAYDANNAAGWSQAISVGLLRVGQKRQ